MKALDHIKAAIDEAKAGATTSRSAIVIDIADAEQIILATESAIDWVNDTGDCHFCGYGMDEFEHHEFVHGHDHDRCLSDEWNNHAMREGERMRMRLHGVRYCGRSAKDHRGPAQHDDGCPLFESESETA